MAEFIGELEPLYQAVAKLLITKFPQMPLETFAQPPDSIDQRADIERPIW